MCLAKEGSLSSSAVGFEVSSPVLTNIGAVLDLLLLGSVHCCQVRHP